MEAILIPVQILIKYRECDREADYITYKGNEFLHTDLNKLSESIKTKGFTEPVKLTIQSNKALLTDGNHRLACSLRLGLNNIPVELEYIDQLEESSYKMYVEEKMDHSIIIDKELSKYLH